MCQSLNAKALSRIGCFLGLPAQARVTEVHDTEEGSNKQHYFRVDNNGQVRTNGSTSKSAFGNCRVCEIVDS